MKRPIIYLYKMYILSSHVLLKLWTDNTPKHTRATKTIRWWVTLKAHGHIILKPFLTDHILTPYHPDLNHIEMIWPTVGEYVSKHSLTFKINDTIDLCEWKFTEILEYDWKPLCDRVKRLEIEYFEQDISIDKEINRFVITLVSNSDSDCEPGTVPMLILSLIHI